VLKAMKTKACVLFLSVMFLEMLSSFHKGFASDYFDYYTLVPVSMANLLKPVITKATVNSLKQITTQLSRDPDPLYVINAEILTTWKTVQKKLENQLSGSHLSDQPLENKVSYIFSTAIIHLGQLIAQLEPSHSYFMESPKKKKEFIQSQVDVLLYETFNGIILDKIITKKKETKKTQAGNDFFGVNTLGDIIDSVIDVNFEDSARLIFSDLINQDTKQKLIESIVAFIEEKNFQINGLSSEGAAYAFVEVLKNFDSLVISIINNYFVRMRCSDKEKIHLVGIGQVFVNAERWLSDADAWRNGRSLEGRMFKF